MWNALIRTDNVISTWEHLAAIEASGINDCEFQYALFYDRETPVACACYYYISFDLDIFNKGLAKKIISFIQKKLFKHFMRMRVIECGTPTALGNSINWLKGADHQEVLRLLVRAMSDFARRKKVKILILRDFLSHEEKSFSPFLRLAFRKVGILPNTAIINHWKNFTEYEMSLRRHHRYIVRRYLRTLEEQGIIVKVLTHYEDLAVRLQELWQGCYDHATEYQREILTPEYFIQLSRKMGDKSRLILFEKEGKAIGFLLGIVGQDIFQGLFAGMDYDYVRDSFLLFNIYLATIRLGIDLGVKVIENGLTSVEEKINFGFKPVPMHAYMRHLSPLLNPILSRLFSLFSTSTRFENRTVFNRRYAERIYGGIEINLSTGRDSLTGKLEDISETGVQISTFTEIKKKRVMIHLHLPQSDDIILVQAKKRWIKKKGDEFFTGFEFLKQDRKKIQTLQKYLMGQEQEEL